MRTPAESGARGAVKPRGQSLRTKYPALWNKVRPAYMPLCDSRERRVHRQLRKKTVSPSFQRFRQDAHVCSPTHRRMRPKRPRGGRTRGRA